MADAARGRRAGRGAAGSLALVLVAGACPSASAQDRSEAALRVEVGGYAQYNSGGLTLFTARLDRWRPGEVALRCQLGARVWDERVTLGPAQRTGEYNRAGAWRHVLGVPLRVPVGAPPDLDLPRGRHRVRCEAQVVGASERASHEADLDFPAIEPLLPDVRVRAGRWFEAEDCTHGAAPVATQPLCVRVFVDGQAGYGVPTARCALDGVALGPGPAPPRLGMVSLRLERPPPGRHRLRCALALTGPAGHESDLRNNEGSGDLFVRPDEAAWWYDLALTAIDAATHTALVPGEYRGQSTPPMPVRGVGLGVTVRNRGGDRIERAEVACRRGGAVLSGVVGPLGPGEARRVEVVAREVAAGVEEARCRVTSVAPREVPDRTPDDNTRAQRVMHAPSSAP